MMSRWEEGYAVAAALVLIILFCTLLFGLTPLIRIGSDIPGKQMDSLTEEERLNRTAEKVIRILKERDDSETDSSSALFMEEIQDIAREESFIIEVNDISSLVNLNTFRDEILISDGNSNPLAGLLFREGTGPARLEEERAGNGFFLNEEDLELRLPELFREEALEKYTTLHGYWNINISDETALEQIFALRTGDSARGEIFRGRVRQARMDQRVFSNERLTEVMPFHRDQLYPAISAVPLINVNYAPVEILRALLHHDFGSSPLPRPEASLAVLLSLREKGPVESGRLPSLLGLTDGDHPIFDYLGTRTWFWKIRVESDSAALQLILAVIPDASGSYRPLEQAGSGTLAGETLRIIGRTLTRKEEEE